MFFINNFHKILTVSLIALTVFCWWIVFAGNSGASSLYFLNVGQADAELVKNGNAVFLIDAGGSKIVSNIDKIVPFYRKKIDVVFISHPQLDHAGGLPDIVKRYKVGIVINNGETNELWENISSVLREEDIYAINVFAGDKIKYGDSVFDVLWPNENLNKDINDNSLVLRYSDGKISSIFTGDISSKAEKEIVKFGDNIKSDILKVAHHGSKTSSSDAFLNVVSPKIAVIEVGKNSYGHPTGEILDRIKEIGAKIFRTDLDGLIKIISDKNSLKVFKL